MNDNEQLDQNGNATRPVEFDELPLIEHLDEQDSGEVAVPWVIELRVIGTASVLQVQVRDELLIGRYDPNMPKEPDINLQPFNGHEKGVSRRHAIIFPNRNRLMIRDLGSANGTFINSHRLQREKHYRLRHGDVLTIGTLMLQVFFAVMPASKDIDTTKTLNFEIRKIGDISQQILIVDDDDNVGHVIGSIIEQAGFKVTILKTVRDAISWLDKGLPTAILLELMLPDMSGLDLVENVRSRPGGENLPLMVVTTSSAEYKINQALDAGVDMYLAKPVGIDELLRGLTKLVTEPA